MAAMARIARRSRRLEFHRTPAKSFCVPCSRTQHYHAPSPGHPYWDLFEVAFRPLFPFRTTNPGVYSDGGRFVLFAAWMKAGAPPLSAFHISTR